MKLAAVTVTALTVLGTPVMAQGPMFEAASVKVNTSGDPGQRMNTLPGRLVAQNMTLGSLIWQAYNVRPAQVDTSGAPGWVRSDHFDIEATFTLPATPEQVSLMLQHLLADRFKLVVRREMRNERAYALVFAQANASFGPALKPARDPECLPAAQGGNPGQAAAPPCGQVRFGPGRLAGTSVSWAQLVNALSALPAVGGPVANGAGERAGLYDFELRWTPTLPGGTPDRAAGADVPDSVFTAVQEQLGLKLNPTAGAPLPVLVVVDARQPSPN